MMIQQLGVSLIDLEIEARLMTRDDRTMTGFLSRVGVLEATHVQADGRYRESVSLQHFIYMSFTHT